MACKIGTEEELQDVIHENLVLLEISGHKINFKKGMFQKNNIAGFESVGYSILMVIDPTECKKSIPWPLIDDKSLRSEFRTKFVEFIKMINKKYPEASIPELTTSMLHFPGGMKFLRFMHKLTSFAMQLQLKAIIGESDEYKNMLPKYECSKKSRHNSAKVNVLRGARQQVISETTKYKNLVSDTNSRLKQLQTCENNISESLESAQCNIENELSSNLTFKHDMLNNLLDISVDDPIKEWNSITKAKVKQLNQMDTEISRMHSLSVDVSKQLREMKADSSNGDLPLAVLDTPCLDGNKLAAPDQLAGRDIKNSRKVLKLESLLRAGREEVRRLCPHSNRPSTSLNQSDVDSLLQQVVVVQSNTEEKNVWMDQISLECEEVSSQLQQEMYKQFLGEQYVEEDKLIASSDNQTIDPFNKELAEKVKENVLSNMEDYLINNKQTSGQIQRLGSIESLVTPNVKHFRQNPASASFIKPKSHQYVTPFYSGKKKTAESSNVFSTDKVNIKKPKLRRSISLDSLKNDDLESNLIVAGGSGELKGMEGGAAALPSIIFTSEEIPAKNSLKSLLKEPKSLVSSSHKSRIPVCSRLFPPKSSEQESNAFDLDNELSEEDQDDGEEESDSSEVDNSKIETKRKSLDLLVARFLKIKESMNKS